MAEKKLISMHRGFSSPRIVNRKLTYHTANMQFMLKFKEFILNFRKFR